MSHNRKYTKELYFTLILIEELSCSIKI